MQLSGFNGPNKKSQVKCLYISEAVFASVSLCLLFAASARSSHTSFVSFFAHCLLYVLGHVLDRGYSKFLIMYTFF
jgi:hypothetical protein